jgi:competence protein ComEC
MKKEFLYVIIAILYLFYLYFGGVFLQGVLEVSFLDVGQGDSILIEAPSGESMLVDGGAGDIVCERLGEELPPWVRKIDIVVLTHPHSDHIQGLMEVLKRYKVSELWFYPVEYNSSDYLYFHQLLTEISEEKGVEIIEVYEGRFVKWGELILEVLWPIEELTDRVGDDGVDQGKVIETDERISGVESLCGEFVCRRSFDENINNDSVVILLSFLEIEMLLMGDAEVDVEEILLDSDMLGHGGDRLIRDIEILKAGHHCSRTASSREFVEVVDPEVAICSCGMGNDFGHPHDESLEIFQKAGVKVLRTDEIGTIRVRTDGGKLDISW